MVYTYVHWRRLSFSVNTFGSREHLGGVEWKVIECHCLNCCQRCLYYVCMVNLVLKPNMPCTSSFALDPRRAGRRTSAHRPRPRMMTRTCMGNRFHVLFRSLQHYTALSGVFVFGWAGWNSLSGYSIYLVSRFYKAASCITRIPEIV